MEGKKSMIHHSQALSKEMLFEKWHLLSWHCWEPPSPSDSTWVVSYDRYSYAFYSWCIGRQVPFSHHAFVADCQHMSRDVILVAHTFCQVILMDTSIHTEPCGEVAGQPQQRLDFCVFQEQILPNVAAAALVGGNNTWTITITILWWLPAWQSFVPN